MIILQGMCYAGKTTCGKMLASSLGIPFLDSKDIFINWTGYSEPDFLEKYGRDRFCEIEENTLKQDFGNIVLSLGGSACYYETMQTLTKHTIVWLDVPFDVIRRRMEEEAKKRPIIFPQGIQTLDQLYNQRKQLYQHWTRVGARCGGGHRITVEDEPPEVTVANIIRSLT